MRRANTCGSGVPVSRAMARQSSYSGAKVSVAGNFDLGLSRMPCPLRRCARSSTRRSAGWMRRPSVEVSAKIDLGQALLILGTSRSRAAASRGGSFSSARERETHRARPPRSSGRARSRSTCGLESSILASMHTDQSRFGRAGPIPRPGRAEHSACSLKSRSPAPYPMLAIFIAGNGPNPAASVQRAQRPWAWSIPFAGRAHK